MVDGVGRHRCGISRGVASTSLYNVLTKHLTVLVHNTFGGVNFGGTNGVVFVNGEISVGSGKRVGYNDKIAVGSSYDVGTLYHNKIRVKGGFSLKGNDIVRYANIVHRLNRSLGVNGSINVSPDTFVSMENGISVKSSAVFNPKIGVFSRGRVFRDARAPVCLRKTDHGNVSVNRSY